MGTKVRRAIAWLGWAAMGCALALSYGATGARAQSLDKPVYTVEEEVTSFAFAPDGRVIFSTRKIYKSKKYEMERDDIWLQENGGKKRKIFSGEKFSLGGDKLLTYLINGFTWSPNGKLVAVELLTTTVNPEDGAQESAKALLLLDDTGRELRPSGKDPLVMNAESPLWLRDNQTLVYLTQAESMQELYSMQFLNVFSGPAGKAFEGRTFLAAARISGSNSAIGVEQGPMREGPPRLQRLDLLSQDDTELASLDEYLGGFSLSPSGTKAAYFIDREVLEVRDLESPNHVARMRVGLGVLQWSGDEQQIFLKRTVEKKSADLVRVRVPALKEYKPHTPIPVEEPEPEFMLHGLTIREYAISRDGRLLGVVLPGKRYLQVFGM